MKPNKEEKMLLQGLLVLAVAGFIIVIIWVLVYLLIKAVFFNDPHLFSFGSFISATLAGILGFAVLFILKRTLT